jgi:hypothetical protein
LSAFFEVKIPCAGSFAGKFFPQKKFAAWISINTGDSESTRELAGNQQGKFCDID